MIPDPLRVEVESHTGAVRRIVPVGGGCVANASRVDAAGGTFFLKTSDGAPGDTFEAEAAGLEALRQAAEGTGLGVPEVLHARNRNGGSGLLLLEWIPPGRPDADYWRRFGAALAGLHAKVAPGAGAYGFTADDFIGRQPQSNPWMEDWPVFFRDHRLVPRIEQARGSGHWRPAWDPLAERLLARLDSLLPHRPHPALLHGDLWSGNQLAGADGRPWLVDPAVYVGHREADLAMTELFGGFGAAFYQAYRVAWPLAPGYEDRREIYNLYHLLNHLLHFGKSYAGAVDRTLGRHGR